MCNMFLADNFYQIVEETCKELYIKSLKDLPPDVREGLKKAYEKETNPVGKEVLKTILKNVEVADQGNLICQDTGIPVYFVKVGNQVVVDMLKLQAAIKRGAERATVEHPLRSSVCAPLSRQNHQTSSGYRIPVIHIDYFEGDYIDILMLPKGSGSENMSYLKMLIPAAGVKGVKKFIVDSMIEIGANPCPPFLVGIGLGGTSDLCMTLAKKAIARPLGSKNPNPEMAALEDELLEAINSLGIGPMGLGGDVTALAVHIEDAYTHITQNPVAINIQCWPARRARAKITTDGQVEIGY